MKDLEPILAEHPFFEGLKAEYVQLLVGCASNVRFDAGAFLCREGDPADRFYLLRHGKVAIRVVIFDFDGRVTFDSEQQE